MQIDHDDVRLLALCQDVTVRKPHGLRPVDRGHFQHFLRVHCRSILFLQLGKARGQEHFTEHIQAVVAGGAVRAYPHIDSLFQETGNRRHAAGQLRVGAGVGYNMQPFFREQIHILFREMNAVIAASAIIKQSQGIQELRRSHAVALQTLVRLRPCFRNMGKKRRLIFVHHFRHLLQQLLGTGVLRMDAQHIGNQRMHPVQSQVAFLHHLKRRAEFVQAAYQHTAHSHIHTCPGDILR